MHPIKYNTNPISNSLMAQSVLFQKFNFEDKTVVGNKTQGVINRITLLNRVKKLNQEDRQELVHVLDELSAQIKSQSKIVIEPIVPISEKGVCTLILADDGSQAEAHGFFTRFLNILMNLFKLRISSGSIIDRISETRDLLSQSNIVVPDMDIQVAQELTQQIDNLKQKLQMPDLTGQIQSLINQLKGLQDQFDRLLNQEWDHPKTFIKFFISLNELYQEIEKVLPDTKDIYGQAIESIEKVIAKRKQSQTLPALAQMLTKDMIPYFQKIGAPVKVLEKWQHDLDALALEKNVKDDNKFKYWEKEIISPFINRKLKLINNELTSMVTDFNDDKSKIQRELEIVEKRLKTYEENCALNVRKRELDIERLKAKDDLDIMQSKAKGELEIVQSMARSAEKKLKDLDIICDLIDLLTDAKGQNLQNIARTISSTCRQLQMSPDDELKSTGFFQVHLAALSNFLSDGSFDEKHYEDALNDLKRFQNDNTAVKNLCINWSGFFKSDENKRYDNDEKMEFIDNSINSWTFIFNKLKLEKQEELASYHEKIVKLGEALKVESIAQKPPARPQQQLPPETKKLLKPITPVQTPPAVGSALPAQLQIPIRQNTPKHLEDLRNIAVGLQHSMTYNNKDDSSWYGIVTNTFSSIEQGALNQVYGNFYWIVLDAGKLYGHFQNGSTNDNWGGDVFVNGNSWGVSPPDDQRSFFNQYRLQAMIEVLEGKKRERANQTTF
jgi:hypothetical protein